MGPFIEWLLAPIDPGRIHEVGQLVAWHGRLMVAAWAFLVPTGIIIARFCKILPKQDWPASVDSRFWWHTHLAMQYSAATLTIAALGLIISAVSSFRIGTFHTLFGWAVTALLVAQVLGGILRGTKGGPGEPAPDGSWRGDHYDMTRRRKIFEYLHKTGGYLAVLFASGAILSGLWQTNAPRWMWIGILVWWPVLIGVFIVLQRKGLAADTYEAIWGPDKKHPGNTMRPIGLGIKRRVIERKDAKI